MAAQVKARFYVPDFRKYVTGTDKDTGEPVLQAEVKMRAVTRKTDDNVQWAKYTPSGEVTMHVSQEAGGAFEILEAWIGKDVTVTFELAED